jgi:hypothetical protein
VDNQWPNAFPSSPSEYHGELFLPYNIKTSGGLNWKTGIHIQPKYQESPLMMEVCFWNPRGSYVERRELSLGERGTWTGFVEQLVQTVHGIAFQSPTLLGFSGWSGASKFTVTQFIMNDNGFSHQTFFSHHVDDEWPNPDPAGVISMSVSHKAVE